MRRPATSQRRAAAIVVAIALVSVAVITVPVVIGGEPRSAPTLPPATFSALLPSSTGAVAAATGAPAAASPSDAPATLVEPGIDLTPTARPQPSTPAASIGVEVRATPRPVSSRPATARPARVAVPAAPAPVATAAPRPTVAPAVSQTLSGWASWYDNGTTAMRLPRGTRVRICGPAACVNRIVTDYGPEAAIFPNRIADLMPTDFATVCGCSPSRGTVRVTATIYA